MKRTYFGHRCDLPVISDSNLLGIPPYRPEWVKWFERLKKFTIVDENMPQTRKFFRSNAAIMAEKKRQIRDYPMTIHPFSRGAMYRERILCVSWLVTFLIGPMRWSFNILIDESSKLYIYQYILDVIFLINVLVTAFTGYAVPLTKEIVLSRKLIFKNKIFTYLIPELCACVPYFLIITYITEINLKQSRIPFVTALKILRIFRLRDFLLYLTNIFDVFKIPESISTALVMFVHSFYVILWSAYGVFAIYVSVYTYDGLPSNSLLKKVESKDLEASIQPFNSLENSFVILLTLSACHFYGASEGYTEIVLPIEKLLCSLVMMLGYFCCNYTTAKLLVAFGSSNISETKYDEILHGVGEYARRRKLPKEIYKRMKVYYEYKYQKRFFKEETILSTLPDHLQNEVILFGCRSILEKVHLLKGIPKGILGSMLRYIKREIYLPNDVVIRYGEPLTKMYWVSFGTLSVFYGPNAVEILHFEDGDHFGDESILKNSGTSIITVVSLEISEIYTVSRRDIKHCKAFLNEMTKIVIQYIQKKRELFSTLEKIMINKTAQNRVLADLRRGKILERDNLRENIR